MKLRISILAALALAMSSVGWDCSGQNNTTPATQDPNAGGQAWEQVFGTWTCTADGRADWSFDVIRKSQYGTQHDWVDHDTGTTLVASVHLTEIYLLKDDGTSFRNFEYKTVPEGSENLDHLDEWAQQAAPNTPYTCRKN